MAYDDYEDAPQPELSPTELAVNMYGQAQGLPHEVFSEVYKGAATFGLIRQVHALGQSLPYGRVDWKKLPAGLGLRTILGKDIGGSSARAARSRATGMGAVTGGALGMLAGNPFLGAAVGAGLPLGLSKAGLKGGVAGAIIGTALGVNPLATAAAFTALSILPRAIGGSNVTSTGLKGILQAVGVKTDWLDKIIGGGVYGAKPKVGNITGNVVEEMLSQTSSAVSYRTDDLRTLMRSLGTSGVAAKYGVNVRKLAGTKAGADYIDTLATAVKEGKIGASAAIEGLVSDIKDPMGAAKAGFWGRRVKEGSFLGDVGILFGKKTAQEKATSIAASMIEEAGRIHGGAGTAIDDAAKAGFSKTGMPKVAEGFWGRRTGAMARLGGKAVTGAAIGGLAYMGISSAVSHIYRGAQVMRDNMRSMNTALRLTEFGGRGSFMNDVVNTERERALAGMAFLRSGRDWVGQEARLLAEGFSG